MVRKLVAISCLLMLTSFARASVFDIWTASHSSTADSYTVITASPCVLNAICLNRTAGVGGQLDIWNSSAAVFGVGISTIALIDVSTNSKSGACSNYNTYLSQGLVYLSSGTPAADIDILWTKMSH